MVSRNIPGVLVSHISPGGSINTFSQTPHSSWPSSGYLPDKPRTQMRHFCCGKILPLPTSTKCKHLCYQIPISFPCWASWPAVRVICLSHLHIRLQYTSLSFNCMQLFHYASGRHQTQFGFQNCA